MSLKIQLTEQDYIKSLLLHAQPTRHNPILVVSILYGLILFLTWTFKYCLGQLGSFALFAGTFIYVLYLVLFLIIIPWNGRRIFRQQKNMQLPLEIFWDDEAISFKNELGEGKVPWDHFYKWKHNNDMIMLYHSSVLFHMVPKRAFANEDDLKQFLALVESRVKRKK